MEAFIDEHRYVHGVEPICKALPLAPSTHYTHAARKADPALISQRAKTDEALIPEVQRVWSENFEVYGVRKVWQMRRERFEVARCTVQRLMKRLGLRGVIRGKTVRTTVSDPKAACPLDHVNRQFHADRPKARYRSGTKSKGRAKSWGWIHSTWPTKANWWPSCPESPVRRCWRPCVAIRIVDMLIGDQLPRIC